VPRNNLGVIVGERKNFVAGGNIAGDCAARAGVDVGIHAVEKNKSPIEITLAFENERRYPNPYAREQGVESEDFAIGSQLVTVSEGLLRQGLRGRGVEMQAGRARRLLLYYKTGRSCGSEHAL